MQQHELGEMVKSMTFVLLITSVYSVRNIVEIGQAMLTLQSNERGEIFFDSPGRFEAAK